MDVYMRRLVLIFVALASIVSFTFCSFRENEIVLDTIEAYINEYPDSALVALSEIDESRIRGKACKNHYNLLMAQAKDKCFIDETDDSLMLSVVDYYSKVRNKEKLFKAYYYLGRIQQNAGRYPEAMLSFIEAEQLIEASETEFQKGLLYAQFGKLYEQQMNLADALSAFEKASYYYIKAGSLPHQYYTTLDIGHLYLRMCNYGAAESPIKEVMEWAYQSGNDYLTGYACDLLCMLYEAMGDFQSLNDLLNSNYAASCPNSLIRNLSLAYKSAMDNCPALVQRYFDSAWTAAISATDSATIYHQEYLVYQLSGQDDVALAAHEKLLAIQDSLVRSALQQPLQYIQAEYYKTKASYIELQAKSRYVIAGLLITLLMVTLCVIVISYKRKLEKKNNEIDQYIEQVEGLRNDIDKNLAENAAMMSVIDGKDDNIRNMEASIAELFSKQYKFLDKLCSVYYETHGCRKDKDAIYKQVKTEIERFSTDKKFLHELESILNLHLDGVMKTIRSELPNLSEMDFRLLCFLLSGFSAKTISVFTGDSTGNIYVKKYRLINEIKSLDSHIATQILSRFS